MDFEKLYDKLPDFLKYNRYFLEFFMKIPPRLSKFKSKETQLSSQNYLLNMLLVNSDVKFTGPLRDIQMLYLELLRFVDNVCKKYDIEYWLDGGTLLGAVRHGGFIPWDDDVDVTMLRKDYNKLIEVLPAEINNYEYLKKNCGLTLLRENEKNYFEDFNDIYDLHENNKILIDTKLLHLQFAWMKPYAKIDFFPKEYMNSSNRKYFEKNYRAEKYKFCKKVKEGKYNYSEKIQEFNEEFGLTMEEQDLIVTGMDAIQLECPRIFKTDKIYPLTTINFEGYEFSAPLDSNHYNSKLYGKNYMNIPTTIDTHNMMPFVEAQFKSSDELNNTLKENIENLKNINDNFK